MSARRAAPLKIDAGGWVTGIERRPSPHFDARPAGVAIELLVIHNISLPPGRFGGGDVLRLFAGSLDCSAHSFYASLIDLRVSAHFFIDRAGRIVQLVSCADRAWHAGVSAFEGRDDCNDFSIGIELEGTDTSGFTATQYAMLARLTRALAGAYPLGALRGHCHIAPERKTDPGRFNWRRLRRDAGLPAAWLPRAPVPVA